jgi:hypothetical protein
MSTRLGARLASPLILLSALGCGSGGAAVQPGPAPTERAPSATAQPVADAPFRFENPGGMWTPAQLASHAELLAKIGFTIPPGALTRPTEFPLGAIVFLGGCSASFVSPDGLVVTNHHCVTSSLQYNSRPEENLLEDGFLARKRDDERFAGPTARIYVTTGFTDVSSKMRDGLASLPDDLARHEALQKREKALLAECEKGRPEVRCSVMSYFGGLEWMLVEQLEIRDVRLVYAPPSSVGNYGGEIDNWRWPRHTGDFAFYRAYVGKDGKPADHAADNVPFRPAHVLKLARTPLRAGDPVMVAGYPARTNRLTTAAEVREAVEWEYPYTIDFCEQYLAELEKQKKADAAVGIKAEPLIRGLGNWLTNTRGQVDGLVKDGLAAKKAGKEAELRAWIDADAGRKAKWGQALGRLDELYRETRKHREAEASHRELARLVRLYSAALTILRNAEERPKPDAERHPDYQARNQKRLEQGFVQMSRQFDPKLDTAMLTLVVERELRLPADKRPGIAAALLGKAALEPKSTPEERAKAIAKLVAESKLGDETTRLSMLSKATVASLEKSRDPMVRLAVALRPFTKASEQRSYAYEGASALVRPLFVEAMREKAGGMLAPDANRSLRITYGTVRGYAPKPGAPVYDPFTALSGVVAKNTNAEPFDAPKALLDAFAAKKLGPYVDERLGEVPVNFLADLDITGGNSGSATLDARGELVGLAFDGNYESMASDWLFMPEVTRSIHVDLRYLLWVLDAVSNADELLAELGVQPAIP